MPFFSVTHLKFGMLDYEIVKKFCWLTLVKSPQYSKETWEKRFDVVLSFCLNARVGTTAKALVLGESDLGWELEL